MDYLIEKELMVKKSFLVCGITNALDGSENQYIRCAKELPDLDFPYVDDSDDPFKSCGEEDSSDESSNDVDSEEIEDDCIVL